MKIKRVISMAMRTLSLIAVAVHLVGCSSVPKPALLDGSVRVTVNDPARLQALQSSVAQDRSLLSDNNLLRAQVGALQQKLMEMTSILRDTLMLPPAAPTTPPVAPVPATPAKPVSPSSGSPSSGTPSSFTPSPPSQASRKPTRMLALPPQGHTTNSISVVIRVFHPSARTEFEPTDAVAQALRVAVRGAERIEVRGHTDSNVVNPMDRSIAIERAEKARLWLINNGADAAAIRTRFYSAGSFLTANNTQQGRALNRRVEIDIRNPQWVSNQVASSD